VEEEKRQESLEEQEASALPINRNGLSNRLETVSKATSLQTSYQLLPRADNSSLL
jgi:hypothetical protein